MEVQNPAERIVRDNPYTLLNYFLNVNSHHVRITVTSDPRVVDHWIYTLILRSRSHFELGRRLIVGLGVTWTALGPTTIQLSQGSMCLVFQLQRSFHTPKNLFVFFSDPKVIFVVGEDSDYVNGGLFRSRGLQVQQLVDLRRVANYYTGCSLDASMAILVTGILGWEWDELPIAPESRNWGSRILSEGQVKNVALEAFLAYLIGKKLKVWKLYMHDY